ncbi:hypothetical protein [Streptomyces sirii]|uniref:hypothetical protein n=1 Tax=Streptomyces sirii TaxID=3127701 RepID=UPI003D3611B6
MSDCGCGCDGGIGGHDERRAPDALYNPPGRPALDYRVGDYGGFLAGMLDRLASPAYPALRGLTVGVPRASGAERGGGRRTIRRSGCSTPGRCSVTY